MNRLARSVRGYDKLTGQVYDETQNEPTTRTLILRLPEGPYRSTGQKQDPTQYRHPSQGSPSLYSMAMRSCAWDIDSFLPSDLQSAEWHYAKMIYVHLHRHKLVTPHIWSLFHQAFPKEMSELSNDFPIRIPAAHGGFALRLSSIHKWLNTVTFQHLVMVNIQGLVLRLEHLIGFTKLPSLGVLFLRHPHGASPQHLDDKSMRDWSRAVQEKKGFVRLKVVGIHHISSSLRAMLECLAKFPAVQICTIEPFNAVVSEQQARHLCASENVPFEVIPEAIRGGPQDPHEIWRNADVSNQVKMKQLYDLANESPAAQITGAAKEPPVLSVHYGQVNSFASIARRLWFTRTGDTPPSNQINQAEKQKQRHGDDLAHSSNGSKKRKIRRGKQSDIGSILGGFG